MGSLGGAAALASLWLPMDIDWRLRLRSTRRDNVA